MSKLVGPNGFVVPTDYFFRKPRFAVGIVPYTSDKVLICDDAGEELHDARFLPSGQVVGLPEDAG
jgi:hypothetical protein